MDKGRKICVTKPPQNGGRLYGLHLVITVIYSEVTIQEKFED